MSVIRYKDSSTQAQRGTYEDMEDDKSQNVLQERQHTGIHVASNERGKRQHTGMHVCYNVRARRQHTVRTEVEHKVQESGCCRRCANVRITLIPPMRSVAEQTKEQNAGQLAHAAKEVVH